MGGAVTALGRAAVNPPMAVTGMTQLRINFIASLTSLGNWIRNFPLYKTNELAIEYYSV